MMALPMRGLGGNYLYALKAQLGGAARYDSGLVAHTHTRPAPE